MNTHGIEAGLEELMQLREQAAHLDFSARGLSRSQLSGRYVSHFRGRGMEYFESRPYVEGDDMRNIDWRVTARTGRPFSKVFIEERERPVLIAADFSPSLFFGTRAALKSVVAARLGALLAWHAIARGDRVGGMLFNPANCSPSELDIRPAGGKKSLLPLLHALSEATRHHARAAGENRLIEAIEHITRVARPGSLVLLLSDFITLGDAAQQTAFRQPLHHLSAHSDVLAFFISDPIEQQLPPRGVIPLTWGKQRIRINGAKKASRQRLQHDFQSRFRWLEETFGQLGQPVIPISTDTPLVDALRHPGSRFNHA